MNQENESGAFWLLISFACVIAALLIESDGLDREDSIRDIYRSWPAPIHPKT